MVVKENIQGTKVVEADVTESFSQKGVPLKVVSTSRTVYDFNYALNGDFLPEKVARAINSSEAQDKAVSQAYDIVGNVLKFHKEKLGLDSFDSKNSTIVSSFYFGEKFLNACTLALA